MKKLARGIFTACIGFVFLIGGIPYVWAQGGEIDEFTLEEITVTAQKREENQQKVPIAMEVISGEQIKEIGRNDIDEILDNVSSILTQSADDGLRVSIRGISNDNNQFGMIQASAPTVAVNQDGVYSNRNSGNQSLYDVERVEILFGPQSTMYASATPGGIVNIVTANPNTDTYEASGTIEYGNYDLLHMEGSLNAPLSDRIALRAAFNTSVRDGYLSNGSNDEDSKSARLKTLIKANDSFSIILTGEITKTAGQGFASAMPFDTEDGHWYTQPSPMDPLTKDGKVTNPWTSSGETAEMGKDEQQRKITAHMDWDTGIGTFSLIPSYVKSTNESAGTSSMMGLTYDTSENGFGTEKGVEVRMTSLADSDIEWIIGANMYKAEDEQHKVSLVQEEGEDDRYQDQWNTQDTKAIYANLTYPFSDRFRATAGARQSWDENSTTNHEIPGKMPDPETWEGTTMEYDDPNFKLGAEYDLSDNSMFYLDISSSYRLNAGGVGDAPPEELMSYTAGAKNRFFGNKLQLNVSAYYYDYKDYYANNPPSQYPVYNEETGEWERGGELALVETGDAVVYGFDIQTSTIITDKDRLDFEISYIKKYFKDLVFDLPDVINNEFGLADVDYSNKDMPQAPNWKISASYDRNFPLQNGGVITARIDARYTTKTCLNWLAKNINVDLASGTAYTTDTTDIRWQEDYHMEDLSLVYMNPDGKWTVSAYINNLRNYAVKRFLDGRNNLMIGNPRTYGMVLSVRY